ncbi:MAG TPA: alpha/beta hydrolase [Candidatus Angelobacter sp.]
MASTAMAQDIAGDWQGTLKAGIDLRVIVHIEKAESGGWKATLYSIDQGTEAIPVTSVTLQGSTLKLGVDLIRGTYEGKVSADGASIAGTWTQGLPLPLELQRATKETAWQRDASPHTVQFVTVDSSVKLEVLDWGGTGRPVVLLAGLGNTAHVFDKFAPKLISTHHVYGITRRGFGASSVPASGYSADRLGDDVLAVIDSLKLDRPVLVGHSIAGEELSSIGTRHPEKIAGLIYLDAAYPYAYYDRTRGNLQIDRVELQKKLEQLQPGASRHDREQAIQELLQTSLPQLEKDLQESLKDLQTEPPEPQAGPNAPPPPQLPAPARAIIDGEQKYTSIRGPILAIYALPHTRPGQTEAAEARDLETTGAQAKAFEAGEPSAHVVRLAHANHYVFESNEADVLREMNAFFASLR